MYQTVVKTEAHVKPNSSAASQELEIDICTVNFWLSSTLNLQRTNRRSRIFAMPTGAFFPPACHYAVESIAESCVPNPDAPSQLSAMVEFRNHWRILCAAVLL